MAAAPTAALLSAIRDGEQRGRSSAAAPSPSRAATAPSCRRQPSHAASGPCRATPGASYIASASLPCYGFSSGRWSLLPWMLHQAEKKLCHSKMEAQAEAAIAVGHYLSSRAYASASASGRQGHERRGASGSKLAPGRQTHYNALLEGLLATARLLRHMAVGGVARNHRTSTPKCSCVLACWPA